MNNYEDTSVTTREYTTKQVVRMLTNYWQLWALFEGKSSPYDTGTQYVGDSASSPPRDGKGSARRREEVLCALLDLEDAINSLPPRARLEVIAHYIKDEKDVTNETERKYLYRTAQKIARIMNECKDKRQ